MSFCILKQPHRLRGRQGHRGSPWPAPQCPGPQGPSACSRRNTPHTPVSKPPACWGSGKTLTLGGAHTDLTLTISAGVPTKPPMQPGATDPRANMWRLAMPTCTHPPRPSRQLTADGAQRHLLVERQGPLAALGHVVPHGLIDGEPSQGVGHLGAEGPSSEGAGGGTLLGMSALPTPALLGHNHHQMGHGDRDGPSQGHTVTK